MRDEIPPTYSCLPPLANGGRGDWATGAKRKEQQQKHPRIDGRAAANFVSLQEIVATASRNLPQDLWDHLSGGSDSETTLLRNRQVVDSLSTRQRALVY